MKQFVLILSFFLVLFASCERTEIEHGFADKVESVFFNPDTASSQLVSCVMKNGDSLSLYGEKDSAGMPLSITHLQYYSSEKKMGALMTFDDGLPSKVLADDGSSVSFEWITRRRANVQVKDPINHILRSDVLDLDSVYSEIPFDWDSLFSNDTNIGDSRIKGSMSVVENVRANKKKIAAKDASWGRVVHVDFKRCGEYAEVDSYLEVSLYITVEDGFGFWQQVDVVQPSKVGNGYDYFIKPYLPTEYWVDKEQQIEVGRMLDAFFSENYFDAGIPDKIIDLIIAGTSLSSYSFPIAAVLLLREIVKNWNELGGGHMFENAAHNLENISYQTQDCEVTVVAEGKKYGPYGLNYNDMFYDYIIDLPDNPQITFFYFSSTYAEFGLSCIPPRSRLRSYSLIYDFEAGRSFYLETDEVSPDDYFSGNFSGGMPEEAIVQSYGIELTTPDGNVLRAYGGIYNNSFWQ